MSLIIWTSAASKEPKRGLPWFVWLAIGLGIVAIVAFVRTSPTCGPTGSSYPGELKAAIIDQLYSLQPNQAFINEITRELEDYGLEVELYQGDEITVDLHRQLPGLGYKVIIFRAHSGLLGSEGEIIKRTCLFTNERYRETRHVAEQLSDQLAMARIDENNPWVFAIGDEFVTQSMQGQFDNTVVIMMGCSCLYLDDLAQAFIEKGASAYLAWNGTVDLSYVDDAALSLVRNLCTENLTVREAVAKTMAEKGPDPRYGAELKYYPPRSGDRAVRELINP
ncbi:unnamed protein product [marine sediment metagenome]|uniref:Uncharacterized protein n=1 Tax=marine sediment metagenome TaxID=412755 RepID=X1L8A1_9ZZZZ